MNERLIRSEDSLRHHFSEILSEAGSTGAVGEILSLLSQGSLRHSAFAEILRKHDLHREPWFPEQRLDLVLGFIRALIADGDLDASDLQSIADLKSCLAVPEGDFISLRPAEVAAILVGQLEQILEDDVIDRDEDLRQAELQTAFDLSYDQYLQLTRSAFERAMSSLTQRLARATADGDRESIRRLGLKIGALDPIYRLSLLQYRGLGALY